MQTRSSAKRKVEALTPMLHQAGIHTANPNNVLQKPDRPRIQKPKYEAKIVEDPLTGLPMLSLGPDAPVLTSEMIRELLTNFP